MQNAIELIVSNLMKIQEYLLMPTSYCMLGEIMDKISQPAESIFSSEIIFHQYSDLLREYLLLIISGESEFFIREKNIMRTLDYLLVETKYDPGYFVFDEVILTKLSFLNS